MNKPVYEIPTGDGESWPAASGRRAAGPPGGSSFPAAPPPPSDAVPSFMPPPSFDEAIGNSFPGADFPAPSFDGGTFSAPAPSFDGGMYAGPAPTFDASVFNAPPPTVPAYDVPPPAAYDAQPAAPIYEAPAAVAAPVYEAPPMPNYEALPAPPLIPEPVAASPSAPIVNDPLAPHVGAGQVGSHPEIVRALNAVVTAGASDLHITVHSTPMIRVDGSLRPAPDFTVWGEEEVTTAIRSILSERQQQIFESDLELDFAYTLSETARFRVNIYQQRNVIGAAFRLIPTQIKQLNTLGVPERIGNFAQLARGLVLVTGPTGSGKSTTLAALVDLVNSTRSDHIVTVEDPIEFMHQNKKSVVNQREVGHDTHSFANALKHVLRQDPDVILIGELRDLETISVALTAAETGHLVFATLHTQDAAQTIDRVIDVFPPHQQGQVRAQLAATLQGVVCQTLVKRVGGGRAVATEVLVMTPAISNLIREGKTYQIRSAMQSGREFGMHSMDQHLADLVNAGRISHQSAYEKAHDVEDLKQLIQRLATNDGGTGKSALTGSPAYNQMG